MKSLGECYYDHFDSFFGNPIGRQSFAQNDGAPRIQILAYDNVLDGCMTFCSLGMSHYRKSAGLCGEIVMPVTNGWNAVPMILSNALFYIAQSNMRLGSGMCIGGVDKINPAFSSAFDKTALYFSYPYPFPGSS